MVICHLAVRCKRFFISGLAVSTSSAALLLGAEFETGQAARAVIGQATFSSQKAGASQRLFSGAGGLAYGDGKLFVADASEADSSSNHRVVMFSTASIPAADEEIPWQGVRCPVCGPAAVGILGQFDFVSSAPNLTRTGLRQPSSVATDGRIVAVADTENNRILVWDSIPFVNGTSASVVLGQPDFRSDRQGISIDTAAVKKPQGVWIQDGRLFVADTGNNRILGWNRIPKQNHQPADFVLGHTGLLPSVLSLIPRSTGPNDLLFPTAVSSDGVRLFVSDTGHHRVLIWSSIPSTSYRPPDTVLGQSDFVGHLANNVKAVCGTIESNAGNDLPARCAATLSSPRSVLSDGTRLFIADTGNNRVLVYKNVPTISGAAADVVLGQKDFTSDQLSAAVDGDASLVTSYLMHAPNGLASNGKDLYVSDSSHRRVLVFSPGESLIAGKKILNAASQQAEPVSAGLSLAAKDTPVLAPGTIITIHGVNLSGDGSTRASPDLYDLAPTRLSGTEVYFDGIVAPLFYVSPWQIKAQVPFSLSNAASGSVYIRKERKEATGAKTVTVSTALPLSLVPGSPGIFAADGEAPQPALITHVDHQPVTPEKPAVPGEAVMVMATGLGELSTCSANRFLQEGRPYQGPQPSSVATPVTAMVAGNPAQILSAGIPTGSVGIYQIVLRLPSNLPTSPKTPLVIGQNTWTSNTVIFPVRGAE